MTLATTRPPRIPINILNNTIQTINSRLQSNKATADHIAGALLNNPEWVGENRQKSIQLAAVVFQKNDVNRTTIAVAKLLTKLHSSAAFLEAFRGAAAEKKQRLEKEQPDLFPKEAVFIDLAKCDPVKCLDKLQNWPLEQLQALFANEEFQNAFSSHLDSLQRHTEHPLLPAINGCKSYSNTFWTAFFDCAPLREHPATKRLFAYEFIQQLSTLFPSNPSSVDLLFKEHPRAASFYITEMLNNPRYRFPIRIGEESHILMPHAFRQSNSLIIHRCLELAEKNPELLGSLLRSCDKSGALPLSLLPLETLKYLCSQHASFIFQAVKAQNAQGETIFHRFVKESGHQDKLFFLLDTFPEQSAEWLKLRDYEGKAPIHVALPDIQQLLYERHPEHLLLVDTKGSTLLHHALTLSLKDALTIFQSDPSIATLLITQDKEGDTPAHLAAKDDNLWRLFNEAFPYPSAWNEIPNAQSLTPFQLALQNGLPSALSSIPKEHRSAILLKETPNKIPSFFYAMESPDLFNAIKSIIPLSKQIEEAKDFENNHFAHFTATTKNRHFAIPDEAATPFLLQNHVFNKDGLLPIHIAAKTGCDQFLDHLSQKKIKELKDQESKEGKRAIHYALEEGHFFLFFTLLNYESGNAWLDFYKTCEIFPLNFQQAPEEIILFLENVSNNVSLAKVFFSLARHLAKEPEKVRQFLSYVAPEAPKNIFKSIWNYIPEKEKIKILRSPFADGEHPLQFCLNNETFSPVFLQLQAHKHLLLELAILGQPLSFPLLFQKAVNATSPNLPSYDLAVFSYLKTGILDFAPSLKPILMDPGFQQPAYSAWLAFIESFKNEEFYHSVEGALIAAALTGDRALIAKVAAKIGSKGVKEEIKTLQAHRTDASWQENLRYFYEDVLYQVNKASIKPIAESIFLPGVENESLEELFDYLDEMNFTDPNAPGYVNNLLNDPVLTETGGIEYQSVSYSTVVEGIVLLLENIYNCTYVRATSKNEEERKQFYEKLSLQIKSLLYRLKKCKQNDPDYVRLRNLSLLKLGVAGQHCAGRWSAEIWEANLLFLRDKNASFLHSMNYLLETWRKHYLDIAINKKLAQTPGRDLTHIHDAYLAKYGADLGISGAKDIQDEYAKSYSTPFSMPQFYADYRPSKIIDSIQLELQKNKHFEEEFVQYIYENSLPTIDMKAKTLYEELEQNLDEGWFLYEDWAEKVVNASSKVIFLDKDRLQELDDERQDRKEVVKNCIKEVLIGEYIKSKCKEASIEEHAEAEYKLDISDDEMSIGEPMELTSEIEEDLSYTKMEEYANLKRQEKVYSRGLIAQVLIQAGVLAS